VSESTAQRSAAKRRTADSNQNKRAGESQINQKNDKKGGYWDKKTTRRAFI
jgi:hypothetical protein